MLGDKITVQGYLGFLLGVAQWDEAEGEEHWAAPSKDGVISVETTGDPVAEISLTLPIQAGAGVVLGQFLNTFAPLTRAKAGMEVAQWGKHLKEGRDMDVVIEAGDRKTRIQSLFQKLFVVTVSCS